jgi:hypothetical protein
MNNNRWSGFVWGVALGLLIGAGLVGGYCWPRMLEAIEREEQSHAEADRARDDALHTEETAHQAWKQAIEAHDRAVKALEDLKNANKDR